MLFTTSPKMFTYFVCVCATLAMFYENWEYHFSFMNETVMMAIIIMFIPLIFFPKSWFNHIWGVFLGCCIIIPVIIELFNGTNNMVAVAFDTLLSLILFGYHGFSIYKKIINKK